MSEAFVTSDGVPLHVVETGADQAGPTMVILHGWIMDHRTWDDVVAKLPSARTLRFDFRGHGRSGRAPKGTRTIDRLADDIAEVVTARVPGKVILVGHSLGAMAMLALAQRHPKLVAERVESVAFVATAAAGVGKRSYRLPMWLADMLRATENAIWMPLVKLLPQRNLLLGSSFLAWPLVRFLAFGRKPGRGNVMRVCAQVNRTSPAAMADFHGEMNRHDRLAAVAGYAGKPAIVLSGDHDRLCNLDQGRAIAAELPGSTFEAYAGAGHMLSYEQTPEVVAHLTTLIATRPGLPTNATA